MLVTELARRLLAARAVGDPVPVVIPMAAWDPRRTTLFDWVSGQLVRINAELGRRVSDGRRYITRAQALVNRMRVLPILDGLDEVVEEARPMVTVAVNRYGWTQPLVVTCRTDQYRRMAGTAHGTPIARAPAVMLQPLELSDIKGYLGHDSEGYWRPLFELLDAEPDGVVARALGNPLMLWLAWAVYSGDDRNPGELADRHRFSSVAAVEDFLLAEFVPAVYPDSKDHRQPPILQVLLPAQPPHRRWLGFLAADEHLHRRWATGRSQDLIEGRDAQSVAWWRFTEAASGYRIVTVAFRAALIGLVIWTLLLFELRRAGNWRHGSYSGPMHFRDAFLSGYVGRSIWPTLNRIISVAPPPATRRHAYAFIEATLREILGVRFNIAGIVITVIVTIKGRRRAHGPELAARTRRLDG
jgi:hypothetical protein